MIWLNPIFSSPNDDNGYDISDYRGIMKEFGTMKDFDELLKGMHKRKLKLVFIPITILHIWDLPLMLVPLLCSRGAKACKAYQLPVIFGVFISWE